MAILEEIEMPKLSLMFENKIVKEVSVGTRPVTIGRSPDNDLPVDNLAVSNHHAKVYFEAGRMVVEDLDSLNGTFVNDLRVERATLHDGDNIHIGKHKIKVDASGDAPVPWDSGRKAAAPRIDETMVLDTKERRQMLQQAAAMGEYLCPVSLRLGQRTLYSQQVAPAASRPHLPLSRSPHLCESPSNLDGAVRVPCVRMPASKGVETGSKQCPSRDVNNTRRET